MASTELVKSSEIAAETGSGSPRKDGEEETIKVRTSAGTSGSRLQ